jgi:hypothetical protein
LLDHVEHIDAEGLDQFLGKMRPDAFHHAGAEVFLDAFQRGRLYGFEFGRLELQPMLTVVDPQTQAVDEFAGGDAGGRANDRYHIAMAFDFDA